MIFKRRQRYKDLLERKRRKINPLNREEFVTSIQASGRIDNLLSTLERMEKLVEWQKEIRNFFFLLIKRHHEDVLVDIIETIKQNFWSESTEAQAELSDEGFFLFNLVCYSGTSIEQATRYYTIIRYIFIAITIGLITFLFYQRNVGGFYLLSSLFTILLIYAAMYWYLCLRIRIELVKSFTTLKESMLNASNRIADSIIEGINHALDYRERGNNKDLAENLIILTGRVGQYENKTKVVSILEADNTTESIEKMKQVDSKLCESLGDKQFEESYISKNRPNELLERRQTSRKTSRSNIDTSEEILSALESVLNIISTNLKELNPSNDNRKFEQAHEFMRDLIAGFEVDKMETIYRMQAFEYIRDILKMFHPTNNIYQNGAGNNVAGDSVAGDKIGRDKIG
jgi:hypothetical protein